MQGPFGRIVLGFIAAAISVLIVHQGIVYALGMYGMTRGVAWNLRQSSMAPCRGCRCSPTGVLGGLWGVLFALVDHKLPGGMEPAKGLIFGLLTC